MYAEDMHSAIGHNDCSSAMSLAADLLEEQKGTIAALNIALGGADSTSTENLIDAHEFDIADVGLIAVCRKLIAEISELKASPLSEEALDILRSKNKQLEQELAEWKGMSACEACATIPSVMEYVQQLEKERELLAAQNEALREAIELYFKQYPHMMKGYILDAINSPNLAAEVLKRRDAETLRRAADRFEAVDPHPKHWDWLRRNSAEIDGKETT